MIAFDKMTIGQRQRFAFLVENGHHQTAVSFLQLHKALNTNLCGTCNIGETLTAWLEKGKQEFEF